MGFLFYCIFLFGLFYSPPSASMGDDDITIEYEKHDNDSNIVIITETPQQRTSYPRNLSEDATAIWLVTTDIFSLLSEREDRAKASVAIYDQRSPNFAMADFNGLNDEDLKKIHKQLLWYKNFLDSEYRYYNAYKSQLKQIRRCLKVGLYTGITCVSVMGIGALAQLAQGECVSHYCEDEGYRYLSADGCKLCYQSGTDYDCALNFVNHEFDKKCGQYQYLPSCSSLANVTEGIIPYGTSYTIRNGTCTALLLLLPFVIPATFFVGIVVVVTIYGGCYTLWTKLQKWQLDKQGEAIEPTSLNYDLIDQIPGDLKESFKNAHDLANFLYHERIDQQSPKDTNDLIINDRESVNTVMEPKIDLLHDKVRVIKNRSTIHTLGAVLLGEKLFEQYRAHGATTTQSLEPLLDDFQ